MDLSGLNLNPAQSHLLSVITLLCYSFWLGCHVMRMLNPVRPPHHVVVTALLPAEEVATFKEVNTRFFELKEFWNAAQNFGPDMSYLERGCQAAAGRATVNHPGKVLLFTIVRAEDRR